MSLLRPRRFAAWLLLGVGFVVLVLAGGFACFAIRASRPAELAARADAIVVLTGGAGRVELALHLLAEGRAARLLVSGAGRVEFADLARLAGVDAALADRVTLGRGARSTRGNARETAEWVRQHGVRSLMLVTSGYHMDRARLELGRTLPRDVAVMPVALLPQAADGHDRVPWRLWAGEYAKWIGAAIGLSGWIAREEEHLP